MIYILILIDILINNYTKYTSFFFLIYLYNKPYKYYLLTGLILDLLIFNTYYNTIILTIMYFLNKLYSNFNLKNIYIYLFISLYNYTLYILLSNLFTLNSVSSIFLSIGNNLIFNFIFYYLSYRIYKKQFS